jgi:hypothetical protein
MWIKILPPNSLKQSIPFLCRLSFDALFVDVTHANVSAWTIDVQTVVFSCRHAAWQFLTPNFFPAVKQGLMLAEADENATYLNQLDARNLLVVSSFHK